MTVRQQQGTSFPTKFVPSGQLAVGRPELLGDNLIIGAGAVDAAVATEIDRILKAFTNNAKPFVGQLGNSFESGIVGVVPSTSVGDPNAWDQVVNVPGTMQVDSTPIAAGSTQSCKMTTTSGATNMQLVWTGQLGQTADLYGRFYFKIDTLPGSSPGWELVMANLPGYSTSAEVFYIVMDTAGKIRILNSSFATDVTSTMTVGINNPCRIEFHFDGLNQVMAVRIFAGANVEGTTPDETLTKTAYNAVLNGGIYNSISSIQFGNSNGQSGVILNFWIDAIVICDASTGSWIGPVVIDVISPASIAAASTVSGAVTKAPKLLTVAQISATSTVSGKIVALRKVAPASISATSAMSGKVTALRRVAPASIAATSTVSGKVTALRKISAQNISATSTVSGSIFKGAFKPLTTATITATSTVSGNLRVTRKVAPANVSATSAVGGNVSALRKIVIGTISATSTLSGSVRVQRAVKPASIAATSTASGSVSKLAAVVGVVSATSTVSGDLRGTRGVSGAITATSTVTGLLRVLTPVHTAQISAISAVSGAVIRKIAIRGIISSTSTVSGSIHMLRRVQPASITAISAVSGSIHMLRGIRPASIFATSTLNGKVVRRVPVVGHIAASSTVSGHAVIRRNISGSVFATAIVSGKVIHRIAIHGNIFATSTMSAQIRAAQIVWGRATPRLTSAEYDPANLFDAGDEIPVIVSVK